MSEPVNESTEALRPSRTADEVFALQPGLARLMPEIGARYWKAYYAADAQNWPLCAWQLREMRKLFRLGNQTRPKYADDVDEYLAAHVQPLFDAVEAEDVDAFRAAFHQGTDRANALHGKWNKGYLVWKLPDSPPPDIDFTPR